MKWEMIDFNLTLAPNNIRMSKCFAMTNCSMTNATIRKKLKEEAIKEWAESIREHLIKIDSINIQIFDSEDGSYSDVDTKEGL